MTGEAFKHCASLRLEKVSIHDGLLKGGVPDGALRYATVFSGGFLKLQRMKLKRSVSRWRSIEGLEVVINHIVQYYLRCICDYYQDNWERFQIMLSFTKHYAEMEDFGVFLVKFVWRNIQ